MYWSRESFLLGFIKDQRFMAGAEKIALAHMRRQVNDPELRAQARRRSFRLGCKRVLLSNHWYPALTRPDVELVTEAITRDPRQRDRARRRHASARSTRSSSARAFTSPTRRRRSSCAAATGARSPSACPSGIQAYLGATISGLPNYFKLIGPNTGLGHNSMIFMIESQLRYVMDALRVMDEQQIATFEVRPEAMAAYNAQVQAKMPGTVWMSGCASWYLDAEGRNTTVWPDFTWRFRHRTRRFDTRAYALRHGAGVPALQAAA